MRAAAAHGITQTMLLLVLLLLRLLQQHCYHVGCILQLESYETGMIITNGGGVGYPLLCHGERRGMRHKKNGEKVPCNFDGVGVLLMY